MKKYLYIVGIVFCVVAISHVLRVLFQVELMIGDWSVPMYVSLLGTAIPAGLSMMGFFYAKRCH